MGTLSKKSSSLSVISGLALAAALVACGGKSENETRTVDAAIARGSNPPGVTMTICGQVVSYVAGNVQKGGMVELDRGRWDLTPGAPVAFEVLLKPKADVCIHATLDPSQRISGMYVYVPVEAADVEGSPDDTSDAGAAPNL